MAILARAQAPAPAPQSGVEISRRAARRADVALPLERSQRHHRRILVGGLLTWLKAISLICLVCWVVSWLVIGVKAADRRPGPLVRLSRRGRADPDAGRGHAPGPGRCQADRRSTTIARVSADHGCVVVLCIVLLRDLGRNRRSARTIRRLGRRSDSLVLIGIHLALALGLAVGLYLQQKGYLACWSCRP